MKIGWEKRAKELFIVEQFAHVQTITGDVLTEIRSNPDDSEEKADSRTKHGLKMSPIPVFSNSLQPLAYLAKWLHFSYKWLLNLCNGVNR